MREATAIFDPQQGHRIREFQGSRVSMVERTRLPQSEPALSSAGGGLPLGAPGPREWRSLHDGTGLSSPGRWPVERRCLAAGPFLPIRALIEEALSEVVERMNGQDQRWDLPRLLFALATSTVKSTPFSWQVVGKLRVKVKAILEKSGTEIEDASGDRTQPLQVTLIQALLLAAGDPDAEFLRGHGQRCPFGSCG